MVKNQKKYLKTAKNTLRKDADIYHFFQAEYKKPVIRENWNPDVANFYMDLYPSLVEEGSNISDLQNRAYFEALGRSADFESFSNVFKMMTKISRKKK